MANVVELIIEARGDIRAVVNKARTELAALQTSAAAADGEFDALLANSPALTAFGVAGGVAFGAIAAGAVVAAAAALQVGNRLAQMGQAAEDARNAAAQVGASASALAGFSRTLADAGLPTQGLGVSLRFLSTAIVEGNPLLKAYGVTAHDSVTALLQFADGLSVSTDATARMRDVTKLLGREGRQLLPVLLEGGDAIRAQIEKYREWGTVLDDVALNKLAAFDDKLDEAKARSQGLVDQLTVKALPAFDLLATAVIKALDQLNRLPTAFENARKSAREFANESFGGIGKFVLDQIATMKAIERGLAAQKRLIANNGENIDLRPSQFAGPPAPPPAQSKTDAQLKAEEEAAKAAAAIAASLAAFEQGILRQRLPAEPGQREARSLTPEEASMQRLLDGLKATNAASLKALGDSVQAVAESAPQLTEAGVALRALPLDIATFADSLNAGLKNTLGSTLDSLLLDTRNFGTALNRAWRSILSSLAKALVDSFLESQAVKSILGRIVNGVIGFIVGGPAGAAAGAIGTPAGDPGGPSGAFGLRTSAGTSITFNVSALDSRSFEDSARAINGPVRRAIERSESLARA